MNSWADVVAYACTLPAVTVAPYSGTLCPKVSGKAFVSPEREADSFHVMASHEEKAVLLETDPDRVRAVIDRAWWDRASGAQRASYGDRP